jgi:hypothetical protein
VSDTSVTSRKHQPATYVVQVASIPGNTLLAAIDHITGDVEAVFEVNVDASQTPQHAKEPKQKSDPGTAGPYHDHLGALKDARACGLEPSATF